MLIGKDSNHIPNIIEFLGVPFARPPVKGLRFKPPLELNAEYYGTGFKAHKLANTCIYDRKNIGFRGYDEWHNNTLTMSEDCLQLNLWVPKETNGAVIVFIYGGGYNTGSPSLNFYNGDLLSYISKSIVVNINFRQGVLGFAYYKKIVSGNIGFLDQQMALKWIKENIKAFGGNPQKITLFGHASGASAANAHLYAPNSKGLFRRIFIDSGTIHNIWAYEKNFKVEENFKTLMKKLKCFHKSDRAKMKCMQKVGSLKLLKMASLIKNTKQSAIVRPFLPIENDSLFFKGNITKKIISNDMIKNVPILFGRITNEAAVFMPIYLKDFLRCCQLNYNKPMTDKVNQCLMTKEQFERTVKNVVYHYNLKKEAIKEIINLYSRVIRTEYRDKTIRLFSDIIFNCDAIDYARRISEVIKGKVYYLVYNIRLTNNIWPKWMGLVYGYQLRYYFGHPFKYTKEYKQEVLEYERKISYSSIRLLTEYVNEPMPIKGWKVFNSSKMEAFHFTNEFVKNNVSIYKTLDTFTCKEWTKIIKKYKK